ncbi:Acetyltransferase (GNAT) family protein [Halorubrum aquaticum]|uniref:Acetyltransferase (GNAT) family protein n=1 Tax=Halorubrum aquaticum TaxID=387340 RepID=A0A1I2Z1M8_9EURY|nr:GNAT family N-acetyltransferase [Halorubrum aquaticum]SFH31753.1 Acetyltransferase (GNAT) family protein [Halorubrum aquaticum]
MSVDTDDHGDDTGAACGGWDGSECEGTVHCPPRCPRFVDKLGDRWTVRPVEPGDADRLIEMYGAFTIEHRAQGIPPAARKRRVEWVESLFERGSNVVAERGDRLLGHAVYTPTDVDRPEIAVFVHPDAQGRGVGTELCRHLIADAAAAGREALELYVTVDNKAAIHVYRTLGFETVERDGDVHMALPLEDPIATEVRWPPIVRDGPTEPGGDDPGRHDTPLHPDHND